MENAALDLGVCMCLHISWVSMCNVNVCSTIVELDVWFIYIYICNILFCSSSRGLAGQLRSAGPWRRLWPGLFAVLGAGRHWWDTQLRAAGGNIHRYMCRRLLRLWPYWVWERQQDGSVWQPAAQVLSRYWPVSINKLRGIYIYV